MTNITQLIIEYKKEKTDKKLHSILSLVNPIIEKKSKYTYFQKYFPISLYNKCQSCRNCEEHKCNICHKCTCQKGTFNLHRNNLCEYEDVKQDLLMEVLKLIEKFDISRDFNKYLIATLWNWKPSFLTKDFIKSLVSESIDNQPELLDKKKICDFNVQQLIEKLDKKIDRDIVYNLLKNNELSQKELAVRLGLTERKLRYRIKKIKDLIVI